ncbi:MAG: CARDB domain-containing protein [Gemmatimonadales bacterium]
MTRHRMWAQPLAVLFLAWTPSPAAAQDSLKFEYAVKFVCGLPDTRAVSPGMYFTAINVHNPNPDSVQFRKKVASTLPGEQPGPISPFSSNLLTPDQALEIDCVDIFRHARLVRFAKGFVVIQSLEPLDIVAVYTAAGRTRMVETLALERVPARRLGAAGCPDLVVDSILRPEWDGANNRSVITAIIRNIGSAPSPATIARVIDPSTTGPTGAPQNAIAATPALVPGASASVVFYLPYWVFNPDATLEVTADYKNDVQECHEDNNTRSYSAIG